MLLRHGHILVRSNRCVEFNEKAYIDIINVFHEIKYLIELKKLYVTSTKFDKTIIHDETWYE